MNAPWPPPQQCTCGCDPCQCECEPCPPTIDAGQIKECWNQVSAFKKMLEEMLAQMGAVAGPQGPSGPQGSAGPAGPAGAQGPAGMSVTYTGATQPTGGSNGELWLNTSDNTLWIYDGANWVDISASSIGTPGPAGAQGAVGPVGAMGPAGPQGPIGPAGSPGTNGKDGGASLTLGAVGTYALMSRLEDVNNSGPLLTIGSQQTNPQMFGNRAGTWQVVNYSFDNELLANGVSGVCTYLLQRIS